MQEVNKRRLFNQLRYKLGLYNPMSGIGAFNNDLGLNSRRDSLASDYKNILGQPLRTPGNFPAMNPLQSLNSAMGTVSPPVMGNNGLLGPSFGRNTSFNSSASSLGMNANGTLGKISQYLALNLLFSRKLWTRCVPKLITNLVRIYVRSLKATRRLPK